MCSVPGERDNLGMKLQDTGLLDIGHKPDLCRSKLNLVNKHNFSFSECETHGLNSIGVSGFIQNHKEDKSLDGIKATAENCNSSCVQNNNTNLQHKLSLATHDMNKINDINLVALCLAEASQSHANIGDDLGNKFTKCYLRTDPGPEVGPQTVPADDGPVLDMCRLNLNHSPATEVNQSQDVVYVQYESELQMPDIMRLITKDLSEPYSIYTYRYFIHNWPHLCFLAMVQEVCVGAIVCKLDMHKKMLRRGYIAMLAVDSRYRRKNIGTNLVKKAIYAMMEGDCDEVVLETEITNTSALTLYENLGFVREKRLFRYYLNGVDALRLKLWLR